MKLPAYLHPHACTLAALITLGTLASPQPALAADAPAPVELSAKRAIQVSFNTKAGERYQLFRSSDGAVWAPAGEVIVGTGDKAVLTFLTDAGASLLFKAETLTGEPVEVIRTLQDFKSYTSWRLVRTLLGPDPFLGGAHGGGTFFRAIYMSPADAKRVNGQFPAGTMFVKELRKDNNGTPGDITDALTIMVKRGGAFSPDGNGWEYFMTDTALSQTLLRGGSDTMCFGCHNAAKDLDFVFSATALNP